MQKNKAKLTLFAILTFVCTLIIGGLAFAVPSMFASAAILPDRFDPDRFTSVTFPELAAPNEQKYYSNGYWVCQDMTYKTLGDSDSETSNILSALRNYDDGQYMYDPSGTDSFDYGSTTADNKPGLNGYEILLDGQGADNYNSENALYQMQYLKFTLAKEGKISFTYRVSSEDDYDAFYLVVNSQVMLKVSGLGDDGNGVIGSYEQVLPKGTYEIAFAYTKDHCDSYGSDSALITNLEFGEGPQNGIYKDSDLEWTAEKGNKIVEENLEMICDAYYDAGGNYRWVMEYEENIHKVFPMNVSGTAGSYTLTSARMINYEDYGESYDEVTGDYYYTLPICLVEIPFTLSSAQTISFNYELYSEDNYDFLLVFIDNTYVFGQSGEYTDSFTSSTLSAGNHTIMFAVVKDGSMDRWYENGDPFEAQITNLNITSAVDISTLSASANQSYSYKGKISAITNYDIYDVFASCYHTEGDPAQNVYDTTGINYGGEAGTYSDVGTVFDNTNGYYFKTIHEAANYFNSIQTASTTFNMVILDDIEVENEATFNNANVATFNIYTDDNDTLRTETNPYILENTNGGSILDLETSNITFKNANPVKFKTGNAYSIKVHESATAFGGQVLSLYGHIIFESSHSDILTNQIYVDITNGTRLESKNTSTTNQCYLIDSKGSGSVTFYNGSITVSINNKGFINLDKAYINFTAYSGANFNYSKTGTLVDHDIYFSSAAPYYADYNFVRAELNGTINLTNKLKVKVASDVFDAFKNNYDKYIGIRTGDSAFTNVFAYYDDQSDTIGKYAFREVYDEANSKYKVYLLENIGVVFNQNIPVATVRGELIRESGDTSPESIISVPFGFAIDEDGEYSSVPNYDVYGYKKLGWSNNTNVYNSYNATNYNYAHLLDSSSNVQITHAFVGGSGKDNYGYSSSNNMTLDDGTIQRYIYYYSRWYKFLGDRILYDDSSTLSIFEGESVVPIYFAEEFIYLSNILCLDEATAYNSYSYAIMDNLNITNYTGYGTDSATGDGKWIYSASSTVKSYSPMCLTEETAFTGTYLVGATRTSDDTNGTFATDVFTTQEDGTRVYLQRAISLGGVSFAHSDSSIEAFGGLFSYAKPNSATENYIKNISLTGLTLTNTVSKRTGGFVGYGVDINFTNLVSEVTIIGKDYAGGVVGCADYGDFDGCINNGAISGTSYLGGIAGYIYYAQVVTGCENNAVITGTVTDIGGISGHVNGDSASHTQMSECYNYANINGKESTGGLFGAVGSARLTSGGSGSGIAISGTKYLGGIAGYCGATVNIIGTYENEEYSIYNNATITGPYSNSSVGADNGVGGIVGWIGEVSNVTIEGCFNSGTVETWSGAGGIVGVLGVTSNSSAMVTIKQCENVANIKSNAMSAGGIAGVMFKYGIVEDCENTGNVSSENTTDGRNIGGIVGYMAQGSVSGSTNSGTIYAATIYVGGIVGREAVGGGTISNCVNLGTVSAATNYAGGIIGYAYADSDVQNSINKGNVSATGSWVGGVAGWFEDSYMKNCYNGSSSEKPQITGGSLVGGVIGEAKYSKGHTIEYVYNYGSITGADRCGGVVGRTNGVLSSLLNFNHGYNYGAVSTTGQYTGGVLGVANYTNVTYCETSSSVTITSTSTDVGGIVGIGQNTGIYASINRAAVSGNGKVGGVVGYVDSASLVGRSGDWVENTGSITSSGENVGGIIGASYADVSFVSNSGTVTFKTSSGTSFTGNCYAGGIVGSAANCQLWLCFNYKQVTSYGGFYVGGIVGRVDSCSVVDCTNTGNSIGYEKSTSIIGGVVGYANGSSLSLLTNNDNMVRGRSAVGGIVGAITGTTINNNINNSGSIYGIANVAGVIGRVLQNCSVGFSTNYIINSGWVECDEEYVGGVAAYAQSSVYYAKNSGYIKCNNTDSDDYAYAGGIVGYLTGATVQHCTGLKSSSDAEYQTVWTNGGSTGGIVGYVTSGQVKNCSNEAKVDGWKKSTGGIVGEAVGSSLLESNANTGHVEGYYDVGGIVGSLKASSVSGCTHKNAKVLAEWDSAGGIVGYAEGAWTMYSCSVQGSCTSTSDWDRGSVVATNSYAGGLVGYILSSTGNGFQGTNKITGPYIIKVGSSGTYGLWIGNKYITGQPTNCNAEARSTIYTWKGNEYLGGW